MKQTIFTLLLISAIGLVSCRKNGVEPSIQQYDQTQIQNYISANGLTGKMVKDTSGGDTTGMYYQILNKGFGTTPLSYSNLVSFVFTLKSFDGKYVTTDTIQNHYYGYIGHINTGTLPYGLELAIINDLKYSGGSMRVLIPSRLAYGRAGYGTGSEENANHIAGNQCLDYYVHIIGNDAGLPAAQSAYDDSVITHYYKKNGLTYTPIHVLDTNSSGVITGYNYYYNIRVPGTGTDSVNFNSTITTNYAGRLLDETWFDLTSNEPADTTSFDMQSVVKGVRLAMTHQIGNTHVTAGCTISMIIPSGLAYGPGSHSANTANVPTNSNLRFEYEVKRVWPQ